MTQLRMSILLLLFTLIIGMAMNAIPIADAGGFWINNQPAALVLGQSNFTNSSNGTTASTLRGPFGAAVDPTTGKLFLADSSNARVLRFSSANALINGSAAEIALGQADLNSGLSNRGGAVAGNTLSLPQGVFVDTAGILWVADSGNSRILRFDNASTKATGANADFELGQGDFTSGLANRGSGVLTNTLSSPANAILDTSGRLWVSDSGNNRVLRFDNAILKANGANADGVLGQLNFTSNGAALSQSGMGGTGQIWVSALGGLFVSERANNRVLRFDNAAAKANGANADGVLGQPNFVTNTLATTQSGMNGPRGVTVDNLGQLFVVDFNNNRVLIFKNAIAKTNGANADNVLGQPDFTTGTVNTGGISAKTLKDPRELFFDNASNVLWVGDSNNNRLLGFQAGELFLPIVLK